MNFSFEHEPTPLENELNQKAEFEAIQSGLQASISEEEHEQIRRDIEGPHVLIASPEKQIMVERIVNEIKAFCSEDKNIIVTMKPGFSDQTILDIKIKCNDFGIGKDSYESYLKALNFVDGFTINGIEEDMIQISLMIKNFYTKIG